MPLNYDALSSCNENDNTSSKVSNFGAYPSAEVRDGAAAGLLPPHFTFSLTRAEWRNSANDDNDNVVYLGSGSTTLHTDASMQEKLLTCLQHR